MNDLDTIASYRDELSVKRARRRANTERVATARAQEWRAEHEEDFWGDTPAGYWKKRTPHTQHRKTGIDGLDPDVLARRNTPRHVTITL